MRLLKKLFRHKSTGFNPSRRRVIKGAAALAALTVLPGSIATINAYQDLKNQLASGLVVNQTFYIDEPIEIAFNNVEIRNCTFISIKELPYIFKVADDVEGTVITGCIFDTSAGKVMGMNYG